MAWGALVDTTRSAVGMVCVLWARLVVWWRGRPDWRISGSPTRGPKSRSGPMWRFQRGPALFFVKLDTDPTGKSTCISGVHFSEVESTTKTPGRRSTETGPPGVSDSGDRPRTRRNGETKEGRKTIEIESGWWRMSAAATSTTELRTVPMKLMYRCRRSGSRRRRRRRRATAERRDELNEICTRCRRRRGFSAGLCMIISLCKGLFPDDLPHCELKEGKYVSRGRRIMIL